jgi:AAA ATPase domain
VSAGVTARSTLAAVGGDRVRALQHALYWSAKADPNRRFHSLRDKVYREDILWLEPPRCTSPIAPYGRCAPRGGCRPPLGGAHALPVPPFMALGEAELVQIKGADEPVRAHRLLGIGDRHRGVGRAESTLVGRRWEMVAAEALLDRAIDGHGGGLGVVGSPGIGKSRLVREVTAKAAARGVEVFTASCESHTTQIPFHAVARLLHAATGSRVLTHRQRVPISATEIATRTPRTCCCSMTCWASPIRMLLCRRSIPMRVGGG